MCKTKVLSAICLFVATLTTSYGAVDIGQYLPVCDRNSPEVNECLVEAVRKGLLAMKSGIKDLGVPPIDPFYQKELKLEYNNNQVMYLYKQQTAVESVTSNIEIFDPFTSNDPFLAQMFNVQRGIVASFLGTMISCNLITVKMIVSEIYVEGVTESTVKDVRLRAEDESFLLEIDMFTSQIFCKGRYSGGGSFNALRINATGDFNTTISDLTYTWKLEGTPEKIDGETYVKIASFYMRPDVGNMVTHLTNENPDSKELTDLGIRITNENWRLLYRELLPFAQSNWNKIGTRIANKIFLKVPYDQLFPVKS